MTRRSGPPPSWPRWTATAFLLALAAFIVVLSVSVLRRWRWAFWLILVAFLAGVLRVPVAILQLTGVLSASAPAATGAPASGEPSERPRLGHAWGMDQRITAGTSGLFRTHKSCYLPAEMLGASRALRAGFFLTQKRSWELRLGITVETT